MTLRERIPPSMAFDAGDGGYRGRYPPVGRVRHHMKDRGGNGRDDWIRTSDPLLPKRPKHPRFLTISIHYAGQIVPFAASLYLWNANQVRTDFRLLIW